MANKVFWHMGVIGQLAPALAFAMVMAGRVPQAHAAGSLTLYSVDGLEELYKAVLPDFEKQEDLKVNLVITSSADVVKRATEEKAAPKADIIVTLPPFIQQAQRDGLLRPYASPNYQALPAISKAPDNSWATFVGNYFTFAVNPEIVKTPPETFDDLLEPEYRFAYSNPESAGDGMAMIVLTTSLMGEDKAFEYLKQLEPLIKFHTKGTGYLDHLLSRDEITVANGDLQMDLSDEHIDGLVLKPIFLALKPGAKPTTFLLPYAIALVNNGPNQAEGQKLIDYLLSKEVQARVPAAFGIPARGDVPLSGATGKEIEKLIAKVDIIPVDWGQVLAKAPAWVARWRKEVIGSSDKQTSVVKPADE